MSVYSLDGSIKSFAVENEFTKTLNKVCYKLGTQLVPFCVLPNEAVYIDNKVLDITSFGGIEDSSISLLDDVVNSRIKALQDNGIGLVRNTKGLERTLFFQYLLSVSICYVEVRKWKTTNGVRHTAYDKFLCTRNPAIMGAWMGMQRAEMQAKYSAKIKAMSHELMEGRLRFVKLNSSSKGNSITVPRTEFFTEDMRCVPLFMLYAFTEGVKTRLENGIVEFTYLKDNSTERKLCSTLSKDILSKFYNPDYVRMALSGVDVNSVRQGGMVLSSKANRGYIKIPELGSSKYDSTGTRSLNLARIISCKEIKEDEVNTDFINVSLDSVVANFEEALQYCAKKMPEELPKISKEILLQDPPEDASVATLLTEIQNTVTTNETLFSTEYRRKLHTFMVSNPSWFPLYTGTPNESSSTSGNFGVEAMDF